MAAGPRCAISSDGHVICTFIVQSKLGINDFVPMQSRSRDGGLTWEEAQPIWPNLAHDFSIFCSVSGSPSGELFLYGIQIPIDQRGETFWSNATQGMKDNQLFWARSTDSGRSWTEPVTIPKPISGSAEAPGPMCVTGSGRWLTCYAPYNTFDPAVIIERNQVVLLASDNQGQSWWHTRMLQFEEVSSGAAEAWVVELADRSLLGTCWQVSYEEGVEYPNPYTISWDGGNTWTPARSTGILGQSTGLAALPDGRALLVYNQRKHGEPGVWLAVSRPTKLDFGLESNRIIWRAERATQHSSSAEHNEWEDFAFGEPSATVLPDRSILVTLWCVQPSGQGIRYVKLRLEDT
ncbi:MAG: glycoside hydrolase [Acidobacteriota bacterium]|nr:glycoside hydrolase [Acidobacteriota bacterium]